MKEYSIYPFKNINISQNYNQGNHLPHWLNSGNYSDKPWDEAGVNQDREYFIPQNDFVVEEILGINSNITNTVRLKSVNKIYLPYGVEDYLYLTLTHMNENNLKEVKVGDVLKKGSKVLLEGTDGNATGNHFHVTANLGRYYGFFKNSNGSWCYVYQKSLLPEEAFFIDSSFNNIIDSKGSKFREVPIDLVGVPVKKNELVNQLSVNVSNLRCRDNPSLKGRILGYISPGIYDYFDSVKNDGYIWYNIGVGFIAYSDDWVIVYPKKEVVTNVNDSVKSVFASVKNSVKKILSMVFPSNKR